jgi:hypothetical protein
LIWSIFIEPFAKYASGVTSGTDGARDNEGAVPTEYTIESLKVNLGFSGVYFTRLALISQGDDAFFRELPVN